MERDLISYESGARGEREVKPPGATKDASTKNPNGNSLVCVCVRSVYASLMVVTNAIYARPPAQV